MKPVMVSDIHSAAHTLRGVAVRTPLLPADWLERVISAPVRLKAENVQRAGAFKIRGAYTMLARLPATERARGVITYSSGNHAQAVALAARMFGVQAVVVMPTTAPPNKVAGAKSYGAQVVLEGTTSTERQSKAVEIALERSLTMIPPFDHPDIIAGQGTVGLEVLEEWPEAEAVLVPVGGGGLLGGIGAYVKQLRPECEVIGVEPEHADAMHQSLKAGEPITIEARPTIADGLMPVRPGNITFEHARLFVDRIVRITDAAIAEAARRLLLESKLVVEFSGAATVAALLSGAYEPNGRKTVAILSGGNLDPAKLPQLVQPHSRPVAQ